jgi:hypothetical protein
MELVSGYGTDIRLDLTPELLPWQLINRVISVEGRAELSSIHFTLLLNSQSV